MNITQLKKKLADLWAKAKGLRKDLETEGLTEERSSDLESQLSTTLDEIEATQTKLRSAMEREQRMARASENLDDLDSGEEEGNEEKRAAATSTIEVGEDREASKPWETFGHFLQAVVRAELPGERPDKRLTRAITGSGETVGSDGGFLVTKDMTTEILRKTYDNALVAGRARKLGVSANANGIKMPRVVETSRATGSRWGGVRGYWVEEAEALTASRPKFGIMELTLKKLVGLHYVTDELLQDQSALAQIATEAFADEFAFLIDNAMVRGTGSGEPQGILNADCIVSVAKETGQAATTFNYENAKKMWSRMWGRSRQNAAWFINQDVEPELYSMSQAVGTGGAPVYLPAGGASSEPFSTLFGRPVIPIEQAATLGTQGDVILADYSQYMLIDKGGIRSDSSIHVRFLNDESVFRYIYRIDGQPIWSDPLTPFQGSNTLSPFVVLDTRS